MTRIATPAVAKAMNGAMIAGTIRLLISPSPLTAPKPDATATDPTSPPIRACELLEGSPKYQVMMFQAIAPTRPANTTVVVTACVSTNPLPTVVATLSEMNAPAKFKSDAPATAGFGAIARVEIAVATTLAVS